jgi:hypothetical protein
MFPVYSGKCLSRKAVHSWVDKFSQGRSRVTDDAQPGNPVEIATEATVQWVKELILADRRIMIDSVATALGCSHGLAYSIMHDCYSPDLAPSDSHVFGPLKKTTLGGKRFADD